MTSSQQDASETPRREAFIGSYVLESLTVGMYNEPRHAVREYVQNGYDAIRRARKTGLLSPQQGSITITLDDRASTLTIEDNGTGIASAAAWGILSSVGASNKDRRDQAGFRGIGRLAGIGFCRFLRFITKYSGEIDETTVTFDCERFRRGMDPSRDAGEDVQTLLTAAITEKRRKLPNDAAGLHYTKVVLEDLALAPEVITSFEDLRSYLCQTAPVDFDPNWQHGETIRKAAVDAGEALETIALKLVHKPAAELLGRGDDDGDERDDADEEDQDAPGALVAPPQVEMDIFKPYQTVLAPKNRKPVSISSIRIIKDKGDKPKWWGWIGVSQLLAAIDNADASGLRVRVRNIQINGTTIADQMFSDVRPSYDRFNHWYVGEIHVLTTDAIPNARRDGFEENLIWQTIKTELTPTFKDLAKKPYSSSKTRSKLGKIEKSVTEFRATVTQRLTEAEPLTVAEKETFLEKATVLAARASDYASEDLLSAEDAARISNATAIANSARKRLESAEVVEPAQINTRASADQILAVVFDVLADMTDPQLNRQLRRAIEQRLKTLSPYG